MPSCNYRRAFLRTVAGAGAAAAQAAPQSTESDCQYWVRIMGKVAEPVLTNLADAAADHAITV
jgi:hypothetical protein